MGLVINLITLCALVLVSLSLSAGVQLPTLIIPNFWYDSWIFPWKQFSALLVGDTRTIRRIDLVRVEVLQLNRPLHPT